MSDAQSVGANDNYVYQGSTKSFDLPVALGKSYTQWKQAFAVRSYDAEVIAKARAVLQPDAPYDFEFAIQDQLHPSSAQKNRELDRASNYKKQARHLKGILRSSSSSGKSPGTTGGVGFLPPQEDQDRFTTGHSYGNTSISGDARNIQGDYIDKSVHNHYPVVPPLEAKNELLLRSLTFPRMGARVRNVEMALPGTCEWLFDDPRFRSWIDDSKLHHHHGFLWIKGKPGSGKSTTMKKAFAWARTKWPNQLVMSYFFNARSPDDLEKSPRGLYRSWVYELLVAHVEWQPIFQQNFALKLTDETVEEWTEAELMNFLIELFSDSFAPATNIFIDALDEGHDNQVQDMVLFLENLALCAAWHGVILRICFSSRHYPYIEITKGLSITLEDQTAHSQDIRTYVVRSLRVKNDFDTNEIQRLLLDRAQGVFLWVVLVLPMMQRLYNQGRNSSTMVAKLEIVPQSLHDLFDAVLSRDSDDFDECVALLWWVLYAYKLLTPGEMYDAIQHTVGLSSTTGNEFQKPPNSLERYILHCSRGLVELASANSETSSGFSEDEDLSKSYEEGESSPKYIQFIHQTVKDFLTTVQCSPQQSFVHLDQPSFHAQFHANTAHQAIAKSCLRYLFHVSAHGSIMSDVFNQFPLARYAARYWWQHLKAVEDAVEQETMELAANLLEKEDTLLMWVQLCNIDAGESAYYNYPPDLTIIPANLAKPIYYAASVNILPLASKVCHEGLDINHAGGQNGNALQAAACRGYEDMVRWLLQVGADPNAVGKHGERALRKAISSGNEKVVQMLIDAGADINDPAAFIAAARRKDNGALTRILLKAGTDINVIDREGTTALIAAAYDNEATTKMLLDAGANVNARNKAEDSALAVAVKSRNEAIVRTLLAADAETMPHSTISSPVFHAISIGDLSMLQLLLDHCETLKSDSQVCNEVLRQAILHDRVDAAKMLFSRGLDPNVEIRPFEWRWSPLDWHVLKNEKEQEREIQDGQAGDEKEEDVDAHKVPREIDAQEGLKGQQGNLRRHTLNNSIQKVVGPEQKMAIFQLRSALAEAIYVHNLEMIQAFVDAGVKIDPDNVRDAIMNDQRGTIYQHGDIEYLLLGTRDLANCGCFSLHRETEPHTENCKCQW